MTKTFAVIFFFVLCVSLFVASNGVPVPDCHPGDVECDSPSVASNDVPVQDDSWPYAIQEALPVNKDDCLEAMNSKRALHSAQVLLWDVDLASDAEASALHFADPGVPPWSTQNGESVTYILHDNPIGVVGNCSEAVKIWYRQIAYYDFDVGENSAEWRDGGFTQLVWNASTSVGVGMAVITKGDRHPYTFTYVVARYAPPGNIPGAYPENVFKN